MTPWYLGVMVDERHAMTLRLDDELYEALRLAAFQQRRAQTAIVTEALRKHLRVACEQAGNEEGAET